MRMLSWNVQGAFPFFVPVQRIKDQIWYLNQIANCPDVIALNEVNRFRSEVLMEELREIGYTDIVHTLNWAKELGESDVPPHQDINHVNGNLIAVHETSSVDDLTRHSPSIREDPWDNAVMKDWSTNFPEKILNSTIEIDGLEIDIWNIRAIPGNSWGEEKIKILENVFSRIKKSQPQPTIFTGDFNSPKAETERGDLVPWGVDREKPTRARWIDAELDILQPMASLSMVDVFRDHQGYDNLDSLDVSHATRTENPLKVPACEVEGVRFDHIFATTDLRPGVCYYDQAGFHCSDHAPIIAEFDL